MMNRDIFVDAGTRAARSARQTVLALTLMAALAALIMAVGGAEAAEPVILQLDWSPNTNYTGVYVAMEKGWFADEGIDLRAIAPGGDTNVEALVGAGRAHFGISAQDFMTSARIEGVPIVSIGAILRTNTSGFASVNRGIEHPADLAGKRYGGHGAPIEKAVLRALMNSVGANVDDIEFVLIPFGIDQVTLLERDIHFTWIFYGWQGIDAELRGIDLDILMLENYPDAIPNYYTPVFITSERLAADNPELVSAFMKAVSKGYTYAAEHPDEAADIFLKYAPEADAELVRASQAWLSPRYIADAPRFGQQEASVWEDFAQWMLVNGLIDEPLDVDAAYTNRFLPDN